MVTFSPYFILILVSKLGERRFKAEPTEADMTPTAVSRASSARAADRPVTMQVMTCNTPQSCPRMLYMIRCAAPGRYDMLLAWLGRR